MTIRVIELFAGIGAQASALERIGVDHELVCVSEIDERAYRAYCAIHGDVPNLGDITKIEHLPECDLLTYSAPCTDISMAGRREGMEEGSGTRSSLLWEVGRLLTDYNERGCLPDVLLMENVDAILFQANMPGFQRWMKILSDMGYTNSYQVLNAKDYGVPQNRKRCFLVSTRTKGKLVFPKPIPLERRLKDVLEPSVPESFYLSEERIATFESHKARNIAKGNGYYYKPIDPDGDSERERVAGCITTHADRYYTNWIDETPKQECQGEPGIVMAGHLTDTAFEQAQRVYDTEGLAPAMKARDFKEPTKIEEPNIEVSGNLNIPGRYESAQRVYGQEGIAPALNTASGGGLVPKIEIVGESKNPMGGGETDD